MKPSLTISDSSGKRLEVPFNPKEYSITKSATWNRPTSKAAKHSTAPEFGGVQPQAVQMELFFDDREGSGSLVKHVETLLGWLKPTDKSINNTQKPQPEVLRFEWGQNQSLNSFKGFLKSVNVKYLLFKPDGSPLRATAQIAIEEMPSDPKKTNPTSGSPAGRRSHVVAAGDTLHSIAFHEYDDPTLWRGLAVFNGVDDPLRVRPGARLLIPTSDEAAVLS